MRDIGIVPMNIRDFDTGEQQYQSLDPDRLFHARPVKDASFDSTLFESRAS